MIFFFFVGGVRGVQDHSWSAGHELAKCPSPVLTAMQNELNHVFTYVLQRQTAKKIRPRNKNTKRILENFKPGQVVVKHQPLVEGIWGYIYTHCIYTYKYQHPSNKCQMDDRG